MIRFHTPWLGAIAVVGFLCMLVGGLAASLLWWVGSSPSADSTYERRSQPLVAVDRAAPGTLAPELTASSNAAPGTKRGHENVAFALGQAILHAWTAPPLQPQAPAWVNAAPRMEDGCYTTSVQAGPFTTPLECDRELPKVLQAAVSDFAELSLNREAAAVRLPDDVLRRLVRDRWSEVHPMEIGGGAQDMVTLHALVVFDVPVQERIKSEAQRLLIDRRVRGAAAAFGGLLGMLALAWSGLKLAARQK